MGKGFEYIRIAMDFGDLRELNALASEGWHVVGLSDQEQAQFALLERRIPAERLHAVRSYYIQEKK